jgi:four helix bundle protein
MRISAELRNRSKAFGSMVIRIFMSLPRQRDEVSIFGRQLIRAGTSVASHVREASRARSDAEFCSKLDNLLQEADESQLWLEYLMEDCQISDPMLSQAHTEADERIAIFTTMVAKVRRSI